MFSCLLNKIIFSKLIYYNFATFAISMKKLLDNRFLNLNIMCKICYSIGLLRFVAITMCLLFFQLIGFAAQKSFKVDNLTYIVRADGDVTVTSCDRDVEGNIEIPQTVESGNVTYNVVWIGSEVFNNIPKLTSITLPAGITGISTPYYDSFYNLPALEKVTVAKENEAFESHDGVLYKKGDAHELVVFPKCVRGAANVLEGLSDLELRGCPNLTSLALPSSLTRLSLIDCTAITSLTLPVSMEDFTTSGCASLNDISVVEGNRFYTAEAGVLYYKDSYSDRKSIRFFPTNKVSYTLPADVELEGSGSFLFAEMPNLVSLSVAQGHPDYVSEGNAIYLKGEVDGGRYLYDVGGGLASFSLPADVNQIREVSRSTVEGFEGKDYTVLELMSKLKTLTTVSGNETYFAKDNILYQHITNFDLGEMVGVACVPMSIQGAVVIPDEVNLIGHMAFFGHTGITSLTLPANALVEYAAFGNCSSLSEVIFQGHIDVESSAFRNTPWYLNHEPGIIYAGTTAIDLVGSPTEISLKDGTTAIGRDAFNGSSLVKITLPSGLEKIGADAFYNSRYLKEINLPASLLEVDEDAFGFCSALTDIYLENGLTFLPRIFDDMPITSIDIPANVVRWFENFSENDELTEIRVAEGNPEFVSVDGVVYTKDKTKVVAVPGGKKDVTLVDGMTGFYTPTENPDDYYGEIFGEGVETLTLPVSLKEIPPSTFADCYNLKSCFVLSRDPIAYDEENASVFPYDLSNVTLYVPVGSKSAYEVANEWKRFGRIVESDMVGISNTEISTVNIEVIDGGLSLSTASEWQIYSSTGNRIAIGKGNCTVALSAGLYVVKAGDTIRKVVIK